RYRRRYRKQNNQVEGTDRARHEQIQRQTADRSAEVVVTILPDAFSPQHVISLACVICGCRKKGGNAWYCSQVSVSPSDLDSESERVAFGLFKTLQERDIASRLLVGAKITVNPFIGPICASPR